MVELPRRHLVRQGKGRLRRFGRCFDQPRRLDLGNAVANRVVQRNVYDERTRQYRGKGKVIGRVAGQLITVLFTLLKRDQERVAHAKGGMVAAPELYDPELHRQHRAGQYQPPARTKLGTVEQLPPL